MKKEMSKKWIIAVVAAVVAVSVLAILLMTGVIGGNSKVPDIVNKSVTEAEKILKEEGFAIVVTKTEINDTVAENTVLSQSPQAGQKLAEGGNVEVTVSIKSVETAIPDVKYYSKDLAVKTLQKAGFKVEMKTENSTEYADTAVMKQSQTGKGKTGSVITITVSKNSTALSSKMIKVPSVVNKTADEAVKVLDKNFYFLIEKAEYSDTVEEGKVIAQTPQADINAAKNNTISVIISLGKAEDKKVIVPNVVRFPEALAKKTLEDADLTCIWRREFNDTVAKGVVISQNIKAGEKVNAKTPVTIVISNGKAPENTTKDNSTMPTMFTNTTANPEETKRPQQNVTPGQNTTVPNVTQKPTEPAGEKKYRADFSIVTDKKEAKAGDIITVSVKLKTNYRIVAASVPVIYDARVFEVVGADENNVSSFLTFSGTLKENGYETNGNWKSPDRMYSSNSNAEYWNDSVRKANNKFVFATWVAMASQGTVMTDLKTEETIVTFKLKVKDNVSDTSGRIYLNSDFIKTASDPQGILYVGRAKSDVISTDSIVSTGQTINIDKANSLVVIK